MRISSIKKYLFILWISTLFLSSAEILRCALNDELQEGLCIQCEKGYVLDQTQISCLLRSAQTADSNCLQVSNSGECMRCACGYAFSIQLDICVMAEDSLIGCEIFREGNICVRPKIEFLLLKEGENSSQVSLQYSHGSFCEIFDISIGRCTRCHSGYKLDKASQCQVFPHKIVNEFFSYFSSDGELQSRSIQFIAWPNKGVFEKIPFCAEHELRSDILDSSILLCKECLPNKSLNKSKTNCLPQPFDLCKIVSDDDHSFCEECVDNDHFYLITDSDQFKQQRQICLPRLTYQLDPTARCLEYYSDSPSCRVCQNGLSLTHYGCSLEKSMGRYIEIKDFDGFSYWKFVLRDPNCDLWIADGVCGQCKKNMIVDIHGNCSVNDIEGCLILDSSRDCAQCPVFFYYEANERHCKLQTTKQNCVIPSRSSDKCEQCVSTYYPDQLGICVFLTMSTCAFSQGREDKCEQCMNLSYLNDRFVCVHLTQYKNCLISDGISDICLKCKRNFNFNTKGQCVSQNLAQNGVCSDSGQYLDKETNSCKEYTFENVVLCNKFDMFNNKCLECYSGSFLNQKQGCSLILNYLISNGIHNRCYYAIFPEYYIDDQGQAQPAMENCITNRIENKCLNCVLENEGHLNYQDPKKYQKFREQCISRDQILNKEVSHQCAHVTLVSQQIQQESSITTAVYRCELCRNLHFLNDNGICTPLTDSDCWVSNGSSNKCLLCFSGYRLNSKSNLCEETPSGPILFCEIMKRNICAKCQSLYYSEQSQCLPISDPDCVESEGVFNICQKCRNGLRIDPSVFFKFQLQSCLQLIHILEEIKEINRRNDQKIGQLGGTDDGSVLDGEKSSTYNQESKSLEEHANPILPIPQYSKLATLILKNLQCEKFNDNLFTCEKCREGYYLNVHNECLKYVIRHCLQMDGFNAKCEECNEGYYMFSNGQECLEVKYCLEFKNACVKCEEETFLFQGQCIKLTQCKEQKNGTCLRCATGFFLKQLFTDGLESQKSKEGRNYNQTKNQLLTDVSFPSSECIQIPHCAESDGVTEFCLKCYEGFRLIQGICVRKQTAQQFDSCQEFHRNSENNQLECVKCSNLYFLRGSYCFSILDINQFCQKNNGVNKDCELCSFRGFKVTEEGNCKQLENCEISNGINQCILCKEQYIFDRQGNCIKIEREILNCQIYQSLQKVWNDKMKQQSEEQLASSSTSPSQSSHDSGSNLYVSEFLGCFQCASLFYPDKETDSQKCLLLNPIESNHCALSAGKTSSCSVCYSGYLLRNNFQNQISCQIAKKAVKLSNFGCELFNAEWECIKCFDSYYLGAKSNCFPRDIERKCAEFDPRKDQCSVCANGYKPKTIKEHNTRETTICMRLEAHEQVIDCLEYHPNTNKCSKCVKHLTQDVVEFFLNEQENLCQDVLHLMCRIISRNGKTCALEYILNCEMYGSQRESSDNANNLSCLQCKNGFYLEIVDKNTICAPHSPIFHCQVYSQTLSNTCELCDLLFFLKQPDICLLISSLNCLFGDKRNDKCLKCLDRFALDIDTGSCVKARILNCEQVQVDSMSTQNIQQICRKCRQNYQLSEKHTECRLRLGSSSCQRFNSESECIECKVGFLLLSTFGHQRECVIASSSCVRSAENCLKYDVQKSNPERIFCEQCKPNFVLDENLQCSPAFASLADKENAPLPSTRSNKGNEEEFLVEKKVLVILVGLTVSFGFVKLIMLLKKRFRNENNRSYAVQQDNNIYFEETNFEIQMAQPIQQINDQSNTTQITSLENNEKNDDDDYGYDQFAI